MIKNNADDFKTNDKETTWKIVLSLGSEIIFGMWPYYAAQKPCRYVNAATFEKEAKDKKDDDTMNLFRKVSS